MVMSQKDMQDAARKRLASKKSGNYTGFDALAKKVGSPKLAAFIGRKKYGNSGMAALAAQGKKK